MFRGVTALRLDSQLCFALYSASRATTAAYRP
ncbi:MarR family transcriptional regulator, partial [Leifsonia sp. SIMBA_070]